MVLGIAAFDTVASKVTDLGGIKTLTIQFETFGLSTVTNIASQCDSFVFIDGFLFDLLIILSIDRKKEEDRYLDGNENKKKKGRSFTCFSCIRAVHSSSESGVCCCIGEIRCRILY